MGGGNTREIKKTPKEKEHKRRTSSVVGKKSLATDNDYTGSCIQPTNQRRCLKKKKNEKVFRGKNDCSANGRGQVLKLQSILANQFASLLGRSGEEAPLGRQKSRNVLERAWTNRKRVSS